MAKENPTKNSGKPAENRPRMPLGLRVITWPVVGAYRLITLPFLRMAYMHYGSIEDTAQRRKKARALRGKLVLAAYALLFVWAHLQRIAKGGGALSAACQLPATLLTLPALGIAGLYYIFWGVLLVDAFRFVVKLFTERLTPDGYRCSDGRPLQFHDDYVDHQQELNDAYWHGYIDGWW